jgi:serine/threonine protein kinase
MKVFKKSVLKKKREFIHKNGGLHYTSAYDSMMKEIGIMKTLNHPNIITLLEVIDDHNCEKLFMGISRI